MIVQDFQVDQVRRRRDAGARAARVIPVAGDDSRDGRTVPVVVVWLRAAVDEVDEGRDALSADDRYVRVAALITDVVVPAGDAGVDHRNAGTGAVATQVL